MYVINVLSFESCWSLFPCGRAAETCPVSNPFGSILQYSAMRYGRHDWPDDDCVKILKNVRKSVGPKSRLLISQYSLLQSKVYLSILLDEFVVQYIVRGGLASESQVCTSVNLRFLYPDPEYPRHLHRCFLITAQLIGDSTNKTSICYFSLTVKNAH